MKSAQTPHRRYPAQPHVVLFSSYVATYSQQEESKAHSNSVRKSPYAVEPPPPLPRAQNRDPDHVLQAQKLQKRTPVAINHPVPSFLHTYMDQNNVGADLSRPPPMYRPPGWGDRFPHSFVHHYRSNMGDRCWL